MGVRLLKARLSLGKDSRVYKDAAGKWHLAERLGSATWMIESMEVKRGG